MPFYTQFFETLHASCTKGWLSNRFVASLCSSFITGGALLIASSKVQADIHNGKSRQDYLHAREEIIHLNSVIDNLNEQLNIKNKQAKTLGKSLREADNETLRLRAKIERLRNQLLETRQLLERMHTTAEGIYSASHQEAPAHAFFRSKVPLSGESTPITGQVASVNGYNRVSENSPTHAPN